MEGTIFKIKGQVQHYAWGGFDYIPSLLGIQNPMRQPFAEYWLGAHPSASALVLTDTQSIPLYQLIQQHPLEILGKNVYEDFGELPFLLKVLDVREMLSIQVHPTKEEAVKGFEREEAAGIPIDASYRNYKDKNHKPEVMVALSDFWLLHGFKKEEELIKTLHAVPEFFSFIDRFDKTGYKGLYEHVMTMSSQQIDELLTSLVKREIDNSHHTKDQPGWWVAQLYTNTSDIRNIDRGVFSLYFFNLVHLQPGEAIFQSAGVPHAYLEGQNVELMANSDNVLRGGLTPKHIDVPELLKHTLFEGVEPLIMKGREEHVHERIYHCPVRDFGICAIDLRDGEEYTSLSNSTEILICMEGEADIADKLHVKRGEAILILPGQYYRIASSSHSIFFKAFVPAESSHL